MRLADCPDYLKEDDILLRQLADRYQVSLQVMIFRLTGMRLINL